MKKILLPSLVTFFLLCNISLAQEGAEINGELIIYFINGPENYNRTLKIQAFGTVWDQFHNVTTNYQGGTKTITENTPSNRHQSDLDWSNNENYPVLSLGLYEISIWGGSSKHAWFFIDYRTSHLLEVAGLPHSIDVVLYYDFTNKSFEFIQPNLGVLNNGDYYPIWEIKELVELETDALQNYWGNALTIIPQYNIYEEYYEPLLIWGPYNGFQPQGYKVYWRYNSSGSYYLLQTVSSGTYQYLHQSVPIGKGGSYLEYKIQAYNNQSTSSFTNIASINSSQIFMDKKPVKAENKIYEFSLPQNYPNPFNPTTTIKYSVPEEQFVSIKLYNSLGQEIVAIVEGVKQAGFYQIKFDASYLPSGIYFCNMKSRNIFNAQKMILQK